MTKDVVAKLIAQSSVGTVDEYGIAVKNETEKTVFALKKAVKRSEFYQAQAAGIQPEFTLALYEFEYSGEKIIEIDGVRYGVIRTYPAGGERIELICKQNGDRS